MKIIDHASKLVLIFMALSLSTQTYSKRVYGHGMCKGIDAFSVEDAKGCAKQMAHSKLRAKCHQGRLLNNKYTVLLKPQRCQELKSGEFKCNAVAYGQCDPRTLRSVASNK